MNKIIGFTGTRKGMTEEQRDSVKRYLNAQLPLCVNHGDCIGADTDFHNIALGLKIPIVIYPSNLTTRAWNKGFTDIKEPKDALERNKDIVVDSDFMIATPRLFHEELRSGTWACIRFALRIKKSTYICWPDGTWSSNTKEYRSK